MNFNRASNPIVRKIGVSDNVPIPYEEIVAFGEGKFVGSCNGRHLTGETASAIS